MALYKFFFNRIVFMITFSYYKKKKLFVCMKKQPSLRTAFSLFLSVREPYFKSAFSDMMIQIIIVFSGVNRIIFDLMGVYSFYY